MAIALDAHTAAGVSINATPVPTPQTFSHTTGSGSNRLLVVTIKMRGGAGGVVTGVTYNGVAMTQVSTESISGSAHATIYYLVNPASGTNTVSIAHSMTGGTQMVASATTLTGVDQTNPLNAFNKASATSAGPMTTSVTTTVADCWVIDACAMRTSASDTATMTAVTNRTQRTNSLTAANGLRGLVSTIGPAAAAGSHTTEWTKTLNHDWAIMAAAFAPAASGTTVTVTAATVSCSGQSVSVLRNANISITAGAVAYAGQPVTTKQLRSVIAAVLTYSGQAITVNARRLVSVAAGAITYAGQTVSAVGSTVLTISNSTMGYIGQLVDVSATRAPIDWMRGLGLRLGERWRK